MKVVDVHASGESSHAEVTSDVIRVKPCWIRPGRRLNHAILSSRRYAVPSRVNSVNVVYSHSVLDLHSPLHRLRGESALLL